MSSIILSNPFVTPQSQHQPTSEKTTQAVAAIAPTQDSSGAPNTGSATSDSGTGSGQGNSAGSHSQLAILADRIRSRPSTQMQDATATSVFGAQTREENAADTEEIQSGQDAITASKVTFTEPVDMSDMPDPLPTSPFLEIMSGKE